MDIDNGQASKETLHTLWPEEQHPAPLYHHTMTTAAELVIHAIRPTGNVPSKATSLYLSMSLLLLHKLYLQQAWCNKEAVTGENATAYLKLTADRGNPLTSLPAQSWILPGPLSPGPAGTINLSLGFSVLALDTNMKLGGFPRYFPEQFAQQHTKRAAKGTLHPYEAHTRLTCCLPKQRSASTACDGHRSQHGIYEKHADDSRSVLHRRRTLLPRVSAAEEALSLAVWA